MFPQVAEVWRGSFTVWGLCFLSITRADRKSQVRQCLGFLFSWFIGQWGPKSAVQNPNLRFPISSVYYMYLIHTDRPECETILDWLDLSVISSLLYKGTKDVIQHVLSSICFAKRTPSCHAAFAKHTPCRTYPMPNIPAANLGEVHHAPGATWLKLPVAPRLSTFRLTAPTSCQPASAAAYTANISLI